MRGWNKIVFVLLLFLLPVFLTLALRTGFRALFLDSSINASSPPEEFYSNWRVVGSRTIKVSDLLSKHLSKKDKNKLLRYLVSSATWHVTKRQDSESNEQELVALKRSKVNGKWVTVNQYGFIDYEFSKNIQVSRVLIRLEEAKLPPWYPGYHSLASIASPSAKVKLYTQNNGSPIESYLVLKDDNGIGIEIFEQSYNPEREFTQSALISVANELRNLSNSKYESGTEIDRGVLASGSIKFISNSEIYIDEFDERGVFNVSGYINPGEKGFIYLKILDLNTNS